MLLPELSEIKKMRVKLGLTQLRLSRLSGISQSIISKLEKGRGDPAYSTVKRLFEFFADSMRTEGVTAEKIMSKSVVFVKPEESVARAIDLMRKHSFSALPVLEGGRAAGNVSDDTLMGRITDGRSVSKMRIAELMEEPFPRVYGRTPVDSVAELLRHSKAVLVTKGERVVGIITKADLLKLIKA